ncbi:hypothetical protein DL96DRAFT_1818626 [Flagelloscypha sp. PMI_526]|nr:hypothetical protein DL96DRAFT_1818626 [Flagelloscypha sp. PMI_526]
MTRSEKAAGSTRGNLEPPHRLLLSVTTLALLGITIISMPSHDSIRASLDTKLDEIASQIASLHEEARAIRTTRNGIAPINQLPTELLALIFHHRRDYCVSIKPKRNWRWTRGTLDVCTHWRNIGLASPHLWNYIIAESFARIEPILNRWNLPFHVQWDSGEEQVEDLRALGDHLSRAVTLDCSLNIQELRTLMSMTFSAFFCASYLQKLSIKVPESENHAYPHLVPLLKKAPNLRFIALIDTRIRNTAPRYWSVDAMDSIPCFPALFPRLASLELAGDFTAGFSTGIDSQILSFPHLRCVQLSDSAAPDITKLLTCLCRSSGSTKLVIHRPVYATILELRDLVQAASAFFSYSSSHELHFHELKCYADHENTEYVRIEFQLITSTVTATNNEEQLILRLPGMYDCPLDYEEEVSAVMDCIVLDEIEKLTLGGPDFPELSENSWKFNETLQTLILQNIQTSFLDWSAIPFSARIHPNFTTLVLHDCRDSANFPIGLVVNLISFRNGGDGVPMPLMVIQGGQPTAFNPQVLCYLGIIEKIEYEDEFMEVWEEAEAEFTDHEETMSDSESDGDGESQGLGVDQLGPDALLLGEDESEDDEYVDTG